MLFLLSVRMVSDSAEKTTSLAKSICYQKTLHRGPQIRITGHGNLNLRSQISDLRSQISNLKSHIEGFGSASSGNWQEAGIEATKTLSDKTDKAGEATGPPHTSQRDSTVLVSNLGSQVPLLRFRGTGVKFEVSSHACSQYSTSRLRGME